MQKFRVGQTIEFRRSNMEVCKAVIIDRRLLTSELRVTYIVNGKEIGKQLILLDCLNLAVLSKWSKIRVNAFSTHNKCFSTQLNTGQKRLFFHPAQ